MRESLEERIVGFTVEFVTAVKKINKDFIDKNHFMQYGKKKIYFEDIALRKRNMADCLNFPEETQEPGIWEFAGNEIYAAYMDCEGYLFEWLDEYERFREGMEYGDRDEARELHGALSDLAWNYGLRYEFGYEVDLDYGTIKFSDRVYRIINILKKFQFYDGEKTECPIVILGPDGPEETRFRACAYGEVIGRVATQLSEKCDTLADDKGYAKYLGEGWLSKDNETDRNYLRRLMEAHVFEKYDEDTIQKQLQENLQEFLGLELGMLLIMPDYLDLILKAVKNKFLSEGGDLEELRIQTAIVREHMKTAQDWCAVDMAYTVTKNVNPAGEKFKPDIVVFDKKYGFGFITLQYKHKSAEDLKKHYVYFQSIVQDCGAVKKITSELKRRSRYLWKYNLIDSAAYQSMQGPIMQNLWQGFVFVGESRKKAASLSKGVVAKQGGLKTDVRCRFAYFPYKAGSGSESIGSIELGYQSMQAFEDFVK